jgi:hypothetical protein
VSTEQEKIEAIKAAIESTKKRRDRLEYLKNSRGIIERAEQFELEMCYETIERGEKLLDFLLKENEG